MRGIELDLTVMQHEQERAHSQTKRLGALAACLVLAPLVGAPVGAAAGGFLPRASATIRGSQVGPKKEYQVKAAFLFNFAKYTTWPKGTFERENSPLIFGIVGRDPFGAHLRRTLAGKKLGKHPIVIEIFDRVENLSRAHVLFAGRMDGRSWSRLVAACKGKAVLLVGDQRGQAKKGAVMSFFISNGKVRFEASIKAIDSARLEVSSQLLKLAVIVEKD